MAYNGNGARTISSGGAVGSGDGSVRRLVHYVTADAKAAVKADDYFLADWEHYPKGTIIQCAAAVDTTPVGFNLIVTASTATTVTTAYFVFS